LNKLQADLRPKSLSPSDSLLSFKGNKKGQPAASPSDANKEEELVLTLFITAYQGISPKKCPMWRYAVSKIWDIKARKFP
jgi:hypothetical protein